MHTEKIVKRKRAIMKTNKIPAGGTRGGLCLLVWHLTTNLGRKPVTIHEYFCFFVFLKRPFLPKLFKIIYVKTSKAQPFYPIWIFQRAVRRSKTAGPSGCVVTSMGKALGRTAQIGTLMKHSVEKSSGSVSFL